MNIKQFATKYLATSHGRTILMLLFIAFILFLSRLMNNNFPLIYRALILLIVLPIFLKVEAEKKYENFVRLICVVSILFSNQVSEELMFKKEIGYLYLGEDAGTIELYIYQNNEYKLAYGGIFGETDKFYGEYKIYNKNIQFDNGEKFGELVGRQILIEGTEFVISK